MRAQVLCQKLKAKDYETCLVDVCEALCGIMVNFNDLEAWHRRQVDALTDDSSSGGCARRAAFVFTPTHAHPHTHPHTLRILSVACSVGISPTTCACAEESGTRPVMTWYWYSHGRWYRTNTCCVCYRDIVISLQWS